MQSVDEIIKRIDAETRDCCVYPQGYNADCMDCTNCRRAFLDKVRQVLIRGGEARLLIIKDGKVNEIQN